MSEYPLPGPAPSLKATLLGGAAAPHSTLELSSLAATLPGPVAPPGPLATDWDGMLDATIAAGSPNGTPARTDHTAARAASSEAGRSTVLPRRRASELSAELDPAARPRFDRVRLLGKGGMGEVELARDNDIRRTVAVKRLNGELVSHEAQLRFADEVRVVGQLEHPGIVPIYDVGRDDSGQVYLVMKHLQGETMEQVIEKLGSGDAEYCARFSLESRVHLFLSVLDAVRYAHARGILHRDIKPANIQIGPFGEVTLMDWGIAKPIARNASPRTESSLDSALPQPAPEQPHEQPRAERLLHTQLGSLAGTPLYMSPEQAAGRNADLDERSDVYALCVLLYEWLVLKHPLQGKTTINEVLSTIISEEYSRRALFEPAHAASVPMEYVWIVVRGLARARERRYQSVSELEDAIKQVLDGRIRVQCHVTLGKRAAAGFSHWIDRHALSYSLLFGLVSIAALATLGLGLWRALHTLG
ncbi:MAG TPA: serine/threonine-protein kinase [Polyangiaceae bacterium]